MKKRMLVSIAVGILLAFDAMGNELVQGLSSDSWAERQNILNQIVTVSKMAPDSERDSMAIAIVDLIKTRQLPEGYQGALHMAIEALGHLRSQRAIPCLVEHLAFLPDAYLVEERLPTEMHYPAAVSLVKIGGHAVDAMKEVLVADGVGDVEKRLALWVVCEISGRKKTTEWLKGGKHPLLLSSGEALADLLPTVGKVLEPPGRRTEWVNIANNNDVSIENDP